MEKAGLVRRVRSAEDKRKAQVWLTPKARKLKARLLPVARHITIQARDGVAKAEFELFRDVILRMTHNLDKLKR
jgi:DNA-binding MarR family transcriptional regulator